MERNYQYSPDSGSTENKRQGVTELQFRPIMCVDAYPNFTRILQCNADDVNGKYNECINVLLPRYLQLYYYFSSFYFRKKTKYAIIMIFAAHRT